MSESLPSLQDWIDESMTLLQFMWPADAGMALFGEGLTDAERARIADSERAVVDAALCAMAVAPTPAVARERICECLSADALIALFSRWAHYHALWQQALADPSLGEQWVPPNQVWRGVLLAMCDDRQRAIDLALQIWAEAAAAFPVLR